MTESKEERMVTENHVQNVMRIFMGKKWGGQLRTNIAKMERTITGKADAVLQ